MIYHTISIVVAVPLLFLQGCHDPVMANTNQAPRISAGGMLLVEGGSWVTLPVAAHDCDGGTLAFSWRQLGGPSINMADQDQPWLRIFAPEVDHKTLARFEVTVTNNTGLSAHATRCVLLLPTGDSAVHQQDLLADTLEAEAACDLQLQADIN